MADNASNPSRALPTKRTYYLVGYNVLLVSIMAVSLYNVVLNAARADLAFQQKQADAAAAPAPAAAGNTAVATPAVNDTTAKAAGTETAVQPAPTQRPESSVPVESRNLIMISYVLWAISLAGGLGGALSNLRGVFEHARDKSYFPEYLELPFYLRPVSGVLCGLFTFFLARFFTIALSSGENLGGGWQTLEGMLPYIGIAFLAGFASQEFMERLKETAKSLFGVPTQINDAAAAAPPPATNESAQTRGGGKVLESIENQPQGIAGTQSRSATPAPTPAPSTPLRRGD